METATIAAIVPAAGCGARTGLDRNKVLAPLAGQPLLNWTLDALIEAAPALRTLGLQLSQILIAARREEFPLIEPLVTRHSSLVSLVEGGATRQQSVGYAAHAATADFLLVHDAARPLVSGELLVRTARAARDCGAAIAALRASDTIKIGVEENDANFIASTLDRRTVWLAQTPQVFRRDVFLEALEAAERAGFEGTDCASLVERIGRRVALVPGDGENFKVTFSADLERAEAILRQR